MNVMIRPVLPYNNLVSEANGLTVLCAVLLLTGTVFAAWCLGLYAANHFGGNKKKTALVFAGMMGLVMLAMLCFFGCAAVAIRGAVFALILAFSSYSDLKTRECGDYLHLMIVIAALIGIEPEVLPGMILSGIAVGAIMLLPAFFSKHALGGADIKCATACAFLLGFPKGILGLTAGLVLAVIIHAIRDRKKRQAGFPLIPYLAVGFTAAYFI